MRFIGIEFDNKVNNTHVEGYSIIPEMFNSTWQIGFRKYLTNTYKAQDIKIYNLAIFSGVEATEYMNSLKSKTCLIKDLDNAVCCTKAFPRSEDNDTIRRQWQSMYPMIHTYI